MGWTWVFYIHALAIGLLTALWALYYRDKANKHPFVEVKEQLKISSGKIATKLNEKVSQAIKTESDIS